MSLIRGAISTQSTRRRPQERNRCLHRRRTAGSSNLRRPCSLPRSGRRDIRRHLLSTPRWSESASQIRGTTSDSRLDASLSSLSCLDLSVDASRTIQAQNTWAQGFCRNARCAPRLCKQLLTPRGRSRPRPLPLPKNPLNPSIRNQPDQRDQDVETSCDRGVDERCGNCDDVEHGGDLPLEVRTEGFGEQ